MHKTVLFCEFFVLVREKYVLRIQRHQDFGFLNWKLIQICCLSVQSMQFLSECSGSEQYLGQRGPRALFTCIGQHTYDCLCHSVCLQSVEGWVQHCQFCRHKDAGGFLNAPNYVEGQGGNCKWIIGYMIAWISPQLTTKAQAVLAHSPTSRTRERIRRVKGKKTHGLR